MEEPSCTVRLTTRRGLARLVDFAGLTQCSTGLRVNDLPDDRSPLAMAMAWTSRIMTIAVEMVLPSLLGIWADRRLGTGMLFVVLGAILGFTMGMWHLLILAKASSQSKSSRPSDEDKRDRSKR
ncbi:hypothetical protein LCGC14_2909700 [marine sediment metagenome]|uniref:AtpZ/AtpI family protein n=1 Tax=marine sediment metagenome TaxID=412755 RepID=A0A0F8ZZQ5_9ZZZZ